MTAAERAAEVTTAYMHSVWCPWNGDHGIEVGYAMAGEDLVAALMADPDLLVDLAIEAGGLVPDEWDYGVNPDGERRYVRRKTDR